MLYVSWCILYVSYMYLKQRMEYIRIHTEYTTIHVSTPSHMARPVRLWDTPGYNKIQQDTSALNVMLPSCVRIRLYSHRACCILIVSDGFPTRARGYIRNTSEYIRIHQNTVFIENTPKSHRKHTRTDPLHTLL